MKHTYVGSSRLIRSGEKQTNQDMYRRFVKRWEQVVDLPVQTVGPFTSVYKILVKRLKVMPLIALIICALLLVLVLYIVFGSTITILTSILQKGF